MVQSIVRLTKAKTKESYIAAIEGRITALSRAHVLLSESRWEGAELRRLLEEELAPYRGGETERIAAIGPAVFLPPSTAQIVALTVHELATNAAKYGALSVATGRVKLIWRVEQGKLFVQWLETGGPAIRAQTRSVVAGSDPVRGAALRADHPADDVARLLQLRRPGRDLYAG